MALRRSSDHPARRGADVAVFEGPLGLEGDLDRLFPIGRHGATVVAFLGDVDDPEPDLGLRLAVSRAAHPGSHDCRRPAGAFLRAFFLAAPIVPARFCQTYRKMILPTYPPSSPR